MIAMALLAVVASLCSSALAQPAVTTSGTTYTLNNDALRVTIDAATSRFEVYDKQAGYLYKAPDAVAASGVTLAIPKLKSQPDLTANPATWLEKLISFDLKPEARVEGIGPDSPADLSATVRLGWTAQGLVCSVAVRDDRFMPAAADTSEWWNRDTVEFWIGDRQLGVRFGPWGANVWSREGEVAQIKPVFLPGTGGYTVQWVVPMSLLGTAGKQGVGGQLRFALGVNDTDTGEQRDTQLYYPRGWQHSNSATFAVASLADESGKVVAAVTPPPPALEPITPLSTKDARVSFKTQLRTTSGVEFPATITFTLEPKSADLRITVDADPTLKLGAFTALHPLVLDRPGTRILAAKYGDGIGVPIDDLSWNGQTWNTYGGLDMPWVGLTDGTIGYMLLWELPVSCDNGAARIERVVADKKDLLGVWVRHDPILGTFGAPRTVRYSFAQSGGHVALCKLFRQYIQEQGFFATQKDKMRNKPQLAWLAGAPDMWGRNDLKFCREAKAAGMDRVLVNGQSPAQDMLEIEKLGFLNSKYDNYEDFYEGRTGLYGEGTNAANVVVNADGSLMKAWLTLGPPPVQAMKRCTYFYPEVARKYTGMDLEKYPYNARFIDVTTAAGLRECYGVGHRLDRSQDREVKRELAKYMADECKLVLGGEHGRWWGADIFNYWEGMQSGNFYSWPAGYVGRDLPQTREAIGNRYLEWGLGEKNRYPLWELVYHDCVVSTWYWGDSTGHLQQVAPDLGYKQDAFNILYGTPPLYWASQPYSYRWTDPVLRARMLESYRNTCKLHEVIGFEEMVSHEFVTEDRAVQHTVFGDGTNVWVNFGEKPWTLTRDGASYILPQYGFYAKGPKIEQYRVLYQRNARQYRGLDDETRRVGGVAEDTGHRITCIRTADYLHVQGDVPGLVEAFVGAPTTIRREGPATMRINAEDAKWLRVNWREICPEAGAGDWALVELDSEGKPVRLGTTIPTRGDMLIFPEGMPLQGSMLVVGPKALAGMSELSFVAPAAKTPEKPVQGDTLTLRLTVANRGGRDAQNVVVGAYKGSVAAANKLQTKVVSVRANGTTEVSFSFPSAQYDNKVSFAFKVDDDDQIKEMCKADNTTERGYRLQPNWSLWDCSTEVTLNLGPVAREYPVVEMPFDADAERARLGKSGRADPDSIRVVSADGTPWPKGYLPCQYTNGQPTERKLTWFLGGKYPANTTVKCRIYMDGLEAKRHASATDTRWNDDQKTYYGQTYTVCFRDGYLRDLRHRFSPEAPMLTHLGVSSGDTGWVDESGDVQSFTVEQDGLVFTQVRVKKTMDKGHSYEKLYTFYPYHFVVTVLSPKRFGVFSRAYFAQNCKYQDDRGNKADIDGKGEAENVSSRNPDPKWYATWNGNWALSCVAVTPHNGLTYWDGGSMGGLGFTSTSKDPQTQAFFVHSLSEEGFAAPDFAALDRQRMMTPIVVTR
ncbi:MAG: glycoside hydrolase [Armatimonadia bacterium]